MWNTIKINEQILLGLQESKTNLPWDYGFSWVSYSYIYKPYALHNKKLT
jgi:hypothetical protein